MTDGHIEQVQTYVARDGRQIGNYGEKQLRSLYERGHLLPTDHYWREGMEDWSTLGELIPAPPPIARPEPRPPEPDEAPAPGWLIPVLSIGGALFVGLILLSFIVAHYHLRQASHRQIEAAVRQAAEREQKEQPTTGEVKPQEVSSEITRLQDLAKTQNAADRALTEETIALIGDIAKRGQACRDAEKDMLGLGFSPTKLTSMAAIEQRQTAIQAALPTLQSMVGYVTDLDTKIRADLRARGVTPEAADGFVAGMRQSGRTQALLTYWKQELAISNDLLANLDLLKSHFGQWHVEGENVMFNDDTSLTLFRANVDKLKADIAAQQAVQADLQKDGEAPR